MRSYADDLRDWNEIFFWFLERRLYSEQDDRIMAGKRMIKNKNSNEMSKTLKIVFLDSIILDDQTVAGKEIIDKCKYIKIRIKC